jgi:large subunit ribosomal protein L17
MRHRKSFNHLSRTSAHRKAMLANLASSLIMHKRIKTTTAKAKALRTYVEPLITRSKEDTTHSRRMVFKHLGDKYAVSELFREVVAKVGDRPGGYTRIIKIDSRLGDNADMCFIELVDYNENLLAEKGAAKIKTSRRRRGKKKPGAEELKPAAATAEEAVGEPSGEMEEAVPDSDVDMIETVEQETEEVADKKEAKETEDKQETEEVTDKKEAEEMEDKQEAEETEDKQEAEEVTDKQEAEEVTDKKEAKEEVDEQEVKEGEETKEDKKVQEEAPTDESKLEEENEQPKPEDPVKDNS